MPIARDKVKDYDPEETTIFVSIASYRDPELNATLAALFGKARDPSMLRVTVLLQEDAEFLGMGDEGAAWYPEEVLKRGGEIMVIPRDYREARGAGEARATVQEKYNNETFYMQLDSHHLFAENWDHTLITKLFMLQRFSKKPVISQYLAGYKTTMNEEELKETFQKKPFRLTGKFFQEGEKNIKRLEVQNMTAYETFDPYPLKVRFGPVPVRTWNDHNLNDEYSPQPTPFFSGHFVFSAGEFVKEVRYDPNIPFNGEEDSMAIRAWTSGWDIYGMVDENVALHFYGPRTGPTAWNDKKEDWWKLDQEGILRLRELLTEADGCHKKDLEKQYCLGRERSLSGYEEFAGISYGMRLLETKCKLGDPRAFNGDVNSDGELERFLWVSERREVAFQKLTAGWWEEVMDPLGVGRKGKDYDRTNSRKLVEVVPADWKGNSRGDVGPNVVLMDVKTPHKQIRLRQGFFEFREITPLDLPNKNATRNGHNGWNRWKKAYPGAFH